MKFSIVTISFNQVEFLQECIDSVLSQRDDGIDLEYIIVDPGSTDGSRELIDSYGDQVIKVFKKDKGPSDGLNKGFAEASGDIYGYLNSDDILYPNALQKIVKLFRKNPRIDVFSGNGYLIDKDSIILRRLYSDKFDLKSYAYRGCITIQPSSFFRASAYKKTSGFNIENTTNWDGELFVDLGLAGAKFCNLSDFLSGYRIHDQSITGIKKFDSKIDLFHKSMFKKIMSREIEKKDGKLIRYYKLKRKLINFRDTFERIFKGTCYGRGIK